MPPLQTKTVYRFEELTDSAKENARSWWRELENQDFDTSYVIEDAQRMGAILGIELATHPVKLMNGSTRNEPTVYWSGFSSQGDGAQFEGRYAYAKGSAKAIRKEAPTDERLHAIADTLQAIQRKAGYKLAARCDCSHAQYSHSGWMNVEGWHTSNEYSTNVDEDGITRALRDFADWIYRQLEAEYEWRLADEQVDDAITANEYDFDENGRRV